jgi:hypothetical protein
MFDSLLKSDAVLPLSFLALGILSVIPMKLISLSMLSGPEKKKVPGAFFLTPFYSALSWKKVRPVQAGDLKQLLKKGLPALFLFLAIYFLYRALLYRFNFHSIDQAYLATAPFYILSEVVGIFVQCLFLSSGDLLPPTHRSPLRSKSLSDFWGGRWNPWMATWLKQVIYLPLKSQPGWATFLVFLFSGLWHELLLNLPFYLLRGLPLFGTMVAYFVIQGAGVIIDKRFLQNRPNTFRRVWLWIFLVVPCPLFLNEATLRIFLLY